MRNLLICLFFLLLVLSCTDTPLTYVYEENGLKIVLPDHWHNTYDMMESPFGDREVSFKTEGDSILVFHILYNDNSERYKKFSLDRYFEAVLKRALPEVYDGTASEVKFSDIDVNDISGKKVVVKTDFMGQLNSEAIAFLVQNKKVKVFVLFVSEEKDSEMVNAYLSIPLQSLDISHLHKG